MECTTVWAFESKICTLVCRIDVQGEINMQVGKFLKSIKRVGKNRRAEGNFFLKINKFADPNKIVQGEFFLKSTSNGNNKKVSKAHLEYYQSTPKKQSRNTTKPLPNRAE